MMIPTIHLNGTNKENLLEDLQHAYSSLCKAAVALGAAAPNGRDYYPQGPDAIHKAQSEHLLRLIKINDVRKDLTFLMEAIDKQGRQS